MEEFPGAPPPASPEPVVPGPAVDRPIEFDYSGEHAPPPPIKSVTPRQVRLLLLQQGMLDYVESLIAQQDRATQIAWEFAIDFRRDDPLLKSVAAQLGLTEQQIDDFFNAAAQL